MQKICPEYDPNEELPPTAVDRLFKENKLSVLDCTLKVAALIGGAAIIGCLVELLHAYYSS